MNYEYSYITERGLGTIHSEDRHTAPKPRYRGRCICGRTTHMSYSSPAIALTAIRFVHNPNIQGEEHAA